MKNSFKQIEAICSMAIIALAAVIGFSMTACEDPEPTLISINATYTQGSTVVTSDTPLNDLKEGLTVTAYYSDDSKSTVSAGDYVLSGTLSVGSSQITVTYEKKTAVFNVTVTDTTSTPDDDVGTGDIENRKYRVEVYNNNNSATYDYLENTYSGKTYQDIVRADAISHGSTILNTYTNQTFSDVLSKLTSAATSIGIATSSNTITNLTNWVTAALQTNNRNGTHGGFFRGSEYRFYCVNRTSTSPNSYTVEVYNNNNSTTYDYLENTYSGKTYQDIVRADAISHDSTILNTYTNQTFSDVLSKLTSAATSIGIANSSNTITNLTNSVTKALETDNRSGTFGGFFNGSAYRFYYVSQE